MSCIIKYHSLVCAGLGGGYNERESVEYIDREESDDEFDDVSYCADIFLVLVNFVDKTNCT